MAPAPPQEFLKYDQALPTIVNLTRGQLHDEVVKSWVLGALRRGRGDAWAATQLRLDVVNAGILGPPGLNGTDQYIIAERARGAVALSCPSGKVLVAAVVAVPDELKRRAPQSELTAFVFVQAFQGGEAPCQRLLANGGTEPIQFGPVRNEVYWQVDTGEFHEDPVLGPLWYQRRGWRCTPDGTGGADEICRWVRASAATRVPMLAATPTEPTQQADAPSQVEAMILTSGPARHSVALRHGKLEVARWKFTSGIVQARGWRPHAADAHERTLLQRFFATLHNRIHPYFSDIYLASIFGDAATWKAPPKTTAAAAGAPETHASAAGAPKADASAASAPLPSANEGPSQTANAAVPSAKTTAASPSATVPHFEPATALPGSRPSPLAVPTPQLPKPSVSVWLRLSRSGAATQIAITHPSGVPELDVAAVQSIVDALPVDVPPELADVIERVGIQWMFTRDPAVACTTYNVQVFEAPDPVLPARRAARATKARDTAP